MRTFYRSEMSTWMWILLITGFIVILGLIVTVIILGAKLANVTKPTTCPPCDTTCPPCDTTCPPCDTTCPPCDTTCPSLTYSIIMVTTFYQPIQIVANQEINLIFTNNETATLTPANNSCYFLFNTARSANNLAIVFQGMNFVDINGNFVASNIFGSMIYQLYQINSTTVQILSSQSFS